jgi:DNA-binding MarR family transcriptional regulator
MFIDISGGNFKMKETKPFKIGHLLFEKKFLLLKAIVDGHLYAADIVRHTAVSTHGLWMILNSFEQLGIIYRPISWGRRTRPLSLTKEGQNVYDELLFITEKLNGV